MNALALSDEVFNSVSSFVKNRSGLVLTKEKTYLLENRLAPVASEHGYADIAHMLKDLHQHKLPIIVQDQLVEALTTNETLFLRDQKPFDLFTKTLLPSLVKSPGQAVNIWCAACSSGQEPYSILMHTEQTGGNYATTPLVIDASDLSETMIERAKIGIYSQFEVQRGLPIQYLLKYFNKLDNNRWQVKDTLKGKIQFKTANLLAAYDQSKRYDIIFCRNVLIYFDEATKREIITKMASLIPVGGYLVIGASESIEHLKLPQYSTVKDARGVYQRI